MAAGTSDNILKKLEEQKMREGSLPSLLEFYQRLLTIQFEAEQHIDVPELSLTTEAIDNRLDHGLPLLTFDELVLDWSLLSDIFAQVVVVFAEFPEYFGQIPESLKGVKSSRFLSKEVVKAWFEGLRLPGTIVDDSNNEHLLDSIIHASVGPFLAGYANSLLEFVNQERWRRGYCPVCGGRPDFAYLDREKGARWLLCSRCDAEWLFQRLECPYCGTQDQDALAYFTDDKGVYRLYICDKCKHYLKAIDLRQAKSEVLIPFERMLTLDMDAQALGEGYKPCSKDNGV